MSLDFGKLNFSVSFNPTSAFPLDARSYFESLDAAKAAAATAEVAGSSTTTYYFGQTIAVVESGAAKLYTIQPDKQLAEVGGKIAVNENVFAHTAEGKLDLYGFADAVAGAQLIKTDDGKLSWVKPDQTTVEGIQTTVAGLQKSVTDLTGIVGSKTEGTGVFAEIAKKADAEDVYTKSAADAKIAEAIAKAPHLERKKVDSVEAIDATAENADKYIYMVPKTAGDGDHYDEYMVIDGAVERMGDWKVDLSEYAKTADVTNLLSKKVDSVVGSRLMTTEEGTKLEGIAAGANVNVIDGVSEEFAISDDGKVLSVKAVDSSKVTGLADSLAKKVDVDENARLMTNVEAAKLAGITAGANVNIIDGVSEEFDVTVDGKVLSVKAVDSSKVTGLAASLAGKVNVEEGKGLSTHDLTDDLLSKLNASQPNVIESVKVNGKALEVTEKSVDITLPTATDSLLGLVKSSVGENKVAVAEDGTMEVGSINVNKLVQTEGEELILNGGSSKK